MAGLAAVAGPERCAWERAPESLAIDRGSIHVWCVSFDSGQELADDTTVLLTRPERIRAARFKFTADRTRFVAARIALRLLVARYARIAPEDVVFGSDGRGKPRLATGQVPLEFNVAHSGGLALCALAVGRFVGVDVERIDRRVDPFQISGRYFSPDEHEYLKAVRRDRLAAEFFRLWVRKEACLKAWGDGLALPLASFSTLAQADRQRRPIVRNSKARRPLVEVADLAPASNYAAAVAAEGEEWPLHCWSMEPLKDVRSIQP
jgi:4'-phosphopantetheinyl transferase